MIYVLYENVNNTINSALTDFYKRYPESSRIYLDSYDTHANVLQGKMSRPLLNDGWLILCPASIKSSAISKAISLNENNLIIVKVGSEKELNKVKDTLENYDYKIIDNHILDKDFVINWIFNNCNCTIEGANYLYKRVGGKIKDITSSVQILKMLDNVSRKDIDKYTARSIYVGIHDVVMYLLGYNRRTIDYVDIIKFLNEFKYASSWVVKTIAEELDCILSVFSLISSNELTLADYKSQKSLIADKRISKLTDYRLKEYIELFGKVSTEYVYWLRSEVGKIGYSTFSLYNIVILLKIA